MKQKHPFNVYPEMTKEEYSRLKTSVGLGFDNRFPIYLFEDKVLDGWNRYQACLELNIVPTFDNFIGSEYEAIEFIKRSNERRELTPSQRSAMAVKNEEMLNIIKTEVEKKRRENQELTKKNSYGGINTPTSKEGQPSKTNEILGDMFGVSSAMVRDAFHIKNTDQESFDALLNGTKTIYQVKKEEKAKNPQIYDMFDDVSYETIDKKISDFKNSEAGMKELTREEYKPSLYGQPIFLSKETEDKLQSIIDSQSRSISKGQAIRLLIDYYLKNTTKKINDEKETGGIQF